MAAAFLSAADGGAAALSCAASREQPDTPGSTARKTRSDSIGRRIGTARRRRGSRQSSLATRQLVTATPSRRGRWRSDLVAGVDGDDAGVEVVETAALDSRRLHHRLQRFLVRMAPDRFGQVAITVGIAGEQPAHPRQHLERMEVVQRPEPTGLYPREFQYPR